MSNQRSTALRKTALVIVVLVVVALVGRIFLFSPSDTKSTYTYGMATPVVPDLRERDATESQFRNATPQSSRPESSASLTANGTAIEAEIFTTDTSFNIGALMRHLSDAERFVLFQSAISQNNNEQTLANTQWHKTVLLNTPQIDNGSVKLNSVQCSKHLCAALLAYSSADAAKAFAVQWPTNTGLTTGISIFYDVPNSEPATRRWIFSTQNLTQDAIALSGLPH